MTSPDGSTSLIRLVFAGEGSFHTEVVSVPSELVASYERLVDLLREEPIVTQRLYVDMRRLVSASVVKAGDEAGAGESR